MDVWKAMRRGVKAQKAVSLRTLRYVRLDLLRLRARLLHQRKRVVPQSTRLHLGCGTRRVAGWLNVDLLGSEFDIDLGCGLLPWPDGSFDYVVTQHVVEHLDVDTQLAPLLAEVRRVLRKGGQLWLSCPDMEAICSAYFRDQCASLETDVSSRWPGFSVGDKPKQHMMNVLFHQDSEHVNLFDFDFVRWLLERAGFSKVTRTDEAGFLGTFPGFPPRRDDAVSLYAVAE